jgi:hypothetical protein
VEVAPVDQRDLDGHVAELLYRLEPPEAAADHHHAMDAVIGHSL